MTSVYPIRAATVLAALAICLVCESTQARPASEGASDAVLEGEEYFKSGDHKAAYETLIGPAEDGEWRAQFLIGLICSIDAYDMDSDREAAHYWHEQSREQMKVAAEEGDAEAKYHLGVVYERGIGGVEPDKEKAEAWFRGAADAGHEHAPTSLDRDEDD